MKKLSKLTDKHFLFGRLIPGHVTPRIITADVITSRLIILRGQKERNTRLADITFLTLFWPLSLMRWYHFAIGSKH